jgi:hypothetical protein
MSTPTTQQQWDHAKFETLHALERIAKQDNANPATHLAAILTTTLHAAYDMAPSPADADKLIKDCIEWAWSDHVEELAQGDA